MQSQDPPRIRPTRPARRRTRRRAAAGSAAEAGWEAASCRVARRHWLGFLRCLGRRPRRAAPARRRRERVVDRVTRLACLAVSDYRFHGYTWYTVLISHTAHDLCLRSPVSSVRSLPPLGMTGRRTHLHPHRPEHRGLAGKADILAISSTSRTSRERERVLCVGAVLSRFSRWISFGRVG